jgi:4a-hydroxytetrahydrobiopterin dehydratase
MNEWKNIQNKLVKEYEFKNFDLAWAFLNLVADQARKQNHHPTIENTYNKVTLTLTTHDQGNKITQKDMDLAQSIDDIV